MNRRNFISTGAFAAAASVSGVAPSAEAAPAPKPMLMKMGADASDEQGFKALGRWGIKNIVSSVRIPPEENRLTPKVEELNALTDLAAKYDLKIEIYTPPHLTSSHIDREKNPGIMLGKEPERAREIEALQNTIKNLAAAKIPCFKYNMSLLGVLRSGQKPGRGDTSYSSWDPKIAKMDPPLTRAGKVTAEMYWERITYFLEHIVPVAEEYKIRMACHPNDSPVAEWQGIVPVLGSVEGLKKFVQIKESPYHGLNLCQGTLAEMLVDPGKEIYAHLQWFAEKKKIFNVHFRNITGGRNGFSEVAVDEGDVDMFRSLKIYKAAGYPFMIQPDHGVQSPSDNGGDYQSFYYGYIRAMLQAAERSA